MKEENTILFVLTIPPPYGGGEIVSQVLYENIKNTKGFHFVLFSRKRHNKKKQGQSTFFSLIYGMFYIVKVIYSLIIIRPKWIYLGLPKGFGAFLRSAIIIHICRIVGIKIFAELHGESFLFENNPRKMSYLVAVLNKCDKIRVLGLAIKKHIEDISKKPAVFLIPNGIDVDKPPANNIIINQNFNSKIYNFLYFGAISSSKGFFDFIDVFEAILEMGIVNFKLNVIGEWVNNEEKNLYYFSCKNSLLKEHITILGRLTGKAKFEEVSKNDFLIHLTKYDGQPMTIIECMALEIPSIASPIGAIPDMIISGYNGFIVEDKSATIATIRDILIDSEFNYYSYQTNCYKIYKEQYTASKMSEKLTNAINI